MSTGNARGSAYADLVSGLLDARSDPATERFDAELAEAVSSGAVTPDAARLLRFWQRAAQRALVDHVRTVLPPALSALDAARAESADEVAAAEQAWQEAEGGETSPLADPAEQKAKPLRGATLSVPTRRASPSTPTADAPSSLEERRNRMIVAGLTNVPRATATERP